MNDVPPLPAVIGATENVLRALLCRVLADTPVQSYERWVAMNAIARPATSVTDLARSLADALVVDHEVVDEILAGLESDQLTETVDDRIAVASDGAAALTAARERVADVTARLVRDLAPGDVASTRRVHDSIKSAAERELITFQP